MPRRWAIRVSCINSKFIISMGSNLIFLYHRRELMERKCTRMPTWCWIIQLIQTTPIAQQHAWYHPSLRSSQWPNQVIMQWFRTKEIPFLKIHKCNIHKCSICSRPTLGKHQVRCPCRLIQRSTWSFKINYSTTTTPYCRTQLKRQVPKVNPRVRASCRRMRSPNWPNTNCETNNWFTPTTWIQTRPPICHSQHSNLSHLSWATKTTEGFILLTCRKHRVTQRYGRSTQVGLEGQCKLKVKWMIYRIVCTRQWHIMQEFKNWPIKN